MRCRSEVTARRLPRDMVYIDWIIEEMEVTVDENKRRVKRDQGAKL